MVKYKLYGGSRGGNKRLRQKQAEMYYDMLGWVMWKRNRFWYKPWTWFRKNVWEYRGNNLQR